MNGLEDVRSSVEKRTTRLSRNGCGGLSGALPPGSVQSFDEHRHVPVTMNLIPVALGEEDGGGDPAQPMIAALPPLTCWQILGHGRKTGLNGIRARQTIAQPRA